MHISLKDIPTIGGARSRRKLIRESAIALGNVFLVLLKRRDALTLRLGSALRRNSPRTIPMRLQQGCRVAARHVTE